MRSRLRLRFDFDFDFDVVLDLDLEPLLEEKEAIAALLTAAAVGRTENLRKRTRK